MRRALSIVSGLAAAVLAAVLWQERPWQAEAAIEVVYPSDGSVFPPDLVAPTFLWRDNDSPANHWKLELGGVPGSAPLQFECAGEPPPPGEIDSRCTSDRNAVYAAPATNGPLHSWTPDDGAWKRIRAQCGPSGATVAIRGVRKAWPRRTLSQGRVALSVSKDPVAAPIFYRDVPLMPSEAERGVIKPLAKEALPLIAWRLRDVSEPESRVVMQDMPSCANCHSFSGDGATLGMDIDGPSGDKGAYAAVPIRKQMVIRREDLMTWNSFTNKPEGHKTIGFMSQVSPDGQHVVTTVNESVHVVNFTDYRFVQVFYPTRGILAYYSRRTRQIRALPGADDPRYVHCDPTWSPDGTYLIFARAEARDAYAADAPLPRYANDPAELPLQYDLYRIPFNQGRGGTPEPVPGASRNGMSNTFPKISPDGRWLVFVKCRNGQLMRPDSRLWIVPAAGGPAREMRCNTALMNSWHSFSPNGRWMVFSSKCNTPYTQMFLTHLDESGADSPAVLIPNSTAANRAVNLPEFVNIACDDLIAIDVPAVDWRRPLNRGEELLKQGMFAGAVEKFREALRIDATESHSHFLLGIALDAMQRSDEAVQSYRRALEINPRHPGANNNLGILLARQRKFAQAIACFRATAAADPACASAHANCGKALMALGKVDEAIAEYRKALAIDPHARSALINLQRALQLRASAPSPAAP